MAFKLTAAVFLFFACVNFLFIKKQFRAGEIITKPFLMPLLLTAYLQYVSTPDGFIVSALVFSFLGDLFLLAPEGFLTAGILAFFACHVFYTLDFLRCVNFQAVYPVYYLLAVPYVFYGKHILGKLKPSFSGFKIPCVVYLVVLSGMSFASLLRFNETAGLQFWLPFAGSLFFIASDTMLSFENFLSHKKGRPEAVMLTYLLAQIFITAGLSL